LIGNTIKQFFSDVIWNDLDVLMIDLPPGTGDAPLSTMQSIPLDGVIIVSSPQDVAVLVVEKAIKMVRSMNKTLLGLIENMSGIVCPHCGKEFQVLGESQGQKLAERYGLPWLGALPIDPKLAELTGEIEHYKSPADEVIRRLADVAEGKA
jgi:Mrp family chromosome partitioning ATPase